MEVKIGGRPASSSLFTIEDKKYIERQLEAFFKQPVTVLEVNLPKEKDPENANLRKNQEITSPKESN